MTLCADVSMQGNVVEAERNMIQIKKECLRIKRQTFVVNTGLYQVKKLQYLGGTLLGNAAAKAQTSDVGKMKSAF